MADQYFVKFFSPDMLKLVFDQTNLYSCQKDGISAKISIGDLKQVVAIKLIMGVTKMPAYTDYWSRKRGYPPINRIMSLKKYEKIRSYLHFVDNLSENVDGYFKIRNLMEMLRLNCVNVLNETRPSIDEMMCVYKGNRAGSKKQYMPLKPTK